MEMHAGEGDSANSKCIMCHVELSKIISFENVKRSLVERTAETLLRPVGCIVLVTFVGNFMTDY